MKKNWNLLINNNYYSNLNQNIELNFRTRNLKYFTGNNNPINDISFHNSNNNKKSKKKIKIKYKGGHLNYSSDDKKTEFKYESIFDKNYTTTIDSKENSERKNNYKNKYKYKFINKKRNYKPLKLFTDHAIESPFKYNPKYKSIYKNLPNIKLYPKQYGPEIKKKILTNIEIRKNNLLLIKKEKENLKEKKNIEIKKCDNFGKVIKREFNKNKKIEKNKNKNNHALSFEKIISRNKGDSIYKRENSGILTYIKNYNYIANNKHKIVNYKKMISRNEFEIMGQKIKKYGGLTYVPIYTMIDKNIPSVTFSSKDKIKKYEKNIKIRKILSSYNPLKHFEIIDENELSKNNSIKKN